MQPLRSTTPHPHPRLDMAQAAPAALHAFVAADAAIRKSPLDVRVRELVKIRASQLNGCAFCVDMHVREARKLGESEERLHQLVVWRESLLFSATERAALAYAEAATLLREGGVSEPVWDAARDAFDVESLGALVAMVALINAWNRIAVPLRTPPGTPTGT
ncbi:MAG TPA: carboxymuconolactone decarboxylase family protein [Aggregicoccus sp.]|nr:carboxymuconolactone decarboxylase family protein [Aggregicoccus sp.]